MNLYQKDGTLVATKIADAAGQVKFDVVQGTYYYVQANKAGVGEGCYGPNNTAFRLNSATAAVTVLLVNDTPTPDEGALDDSAAGILYTVTVNNSSGTLLPGAQVNIYNSNGKLLGTKTADANGQVSWKVLKGFGYYAVASATGYTSMASAVQVVNTSTAVTITLEATVPVGKEYPVVVHVVDANTQQHITGALVAMFTQQGAQTASGTTNPTITFNATLGTYYFTASATGYTARTTGMYTLTETESSRIITIPLTKTTTENYTFTATVVASATGAKISGATVTVYDAYGEAIASGTTDSSGVVRLSLPAGTGYYAVVSASGYNTLTSIPFAVSKDTAATFKLAKSSSGGSSDIPAKDDGTSPKTGEGCMLHWYILATLFIGGIYLLLRSGKKGENRLYWYDILAILLWLGSVVFFLIRAECIFDYLLVGAQVALAVWRILKSLKQIRQPRQS